MKAVDESESDDDSEKSVDSAEEEIPKKIK